MSCSVRRATTVAFICLVMVSTYFNILGIQTQNQSRDWGMPLLMDGSNPPCPGELPPTNSRATFSATSMTTRVMVRLNETKPKLFHCGGYALNRNLQPTLSSVFPEYEFFDLRHVSDWRGDVVLTTKPWDLYVTNYQLNECQHPEFYQWLLLRFPGKVVFWTPEDATNYLPLVSRPDQFFPLGPGAPLSITFLQTAFWAQIPEPEKQQFFIGTTSTEPIRPRSSGRLFLIYANSRCVGERQSAFRTIANFKGGIFPTVYYGGRCNGGMNRLNNTKVQSYPNKVRLANWEDNRQLYQEFRFCLTMEHVNTPGYITEKILVAFWAGCLPIYWGTPEIFDIFNADSFIYWDIDNPQPALDRIQYLEKNRSAYDEVMRKPILAPGAVTKYFSLDDSHGKGALKNKIRTHLGIDVYRFS